MKIKYKKNNGGFTLVELIVSLTVLIVLVATASGILLSSQNIYSKSVSGVTAKQVANDVYSVLNDRLSYATNLVASSEDETINGKFFGDKSEYPYTECIKVTRNETDNQQIFISRNGSNDFKSVVDVSGYNVKVTLENMPINDDKVLSSFNIKIDVLKQNGEIEYTRSDNLGRIELLNYSNNSFFDVDLEDNQVEDLYINYTYIE